MLTFVELFILYYQEAKAAANFKAQIDKLQQERDEFQRMVIGNQVEINLLFGFFFCLVGCMFELSFRKLNYDFMKWAQLFICCLHITSKCAHNKYMK